MKKLFTILLLALFAVAFTSCAEDPLETDPIVPEISTDALQDNKTSVDRRKRRVRDKGMISSSRG